VKIAISARGREPQSEVDPRFGRAAFFLLFDTGSSAWSAIENRIAADAAHGAGIQAAETVCREGVHAVISGHVGPKAFAVLSGSGIKAYRGDARTVQEALEAFERGQLQELSDSNGP
jgi:predicted Fe-Mo cluster-binding NifX family protein